MRHRTRLSGLTLVAILATLIATACSAPPPRVLVFSKTAAFRHRSIEVGVGAIRKLGRERGFSVDATEGASVFAEGTLRNYGVVVFLSTTGDVLDASQQANFERFIQAGGGYVGIHAASDTEYGWPWYGRLVGAYFVGHPEIQQATLRVDDPDHPATNHLQPIWTRTDEWYDLRYTSSDVRVLLTIEEDSYEGATTGDPHRMSWSHEYDGGRAFYTALGHTTESYSDPAFLGHLAGGIEYALGDGSDLDYAATYRDRPPHADDFVGTVVEANLNARLLHNEYSPQDVH